MRAASEPLSLALSCSPPSLSPSKASSKSPIGRRPQHPSGFDGAGQFGKGVCMCVCVWGSVSRLISVFPSQVRLFKSLETLRAESKIKGKPGTCRRLRK